MLNKCLKNFACTCVEVQTYYEMRYNFISRVCTVSEFLIAMYRKRLRKGFVIVWNVLCVIALAANDLIKVYRWNDLSTYNYQKEAELWLLTELIIRSQWASKEMCALMPPIHTTVSFFKTIHILCLMVKFGVPIIWCLVFFERVKHGEVFDQVTASHFEFERFYWGMNFSQND